MTSTESATGPLFAVFLAGVQVRCIQKIPVFLYYRRSYFPLHGAPKAALHLFREKRLKISGGCDDRLYDEVYSVSVDYLAIQNQDLQVD